MSNCLDQRNPREIEEDPRILYGASCTWWGELALTNLLRGAAFQCPKCGGDLIPQNPDAWWRGIYIHAGKTSDPDYPKFMTWVRGKCFRDPEFAREMWRERR